MYQVTREEDVNVFDGDSFLPQENLPARGRARPTTQPARAEPRRDPAQPPSQGTASSRPAPGALHTVHVTDPSFVDGGGSPFEGQRPAARATPSW